MAWDLAGTASLPFIVGADNLLQNISKRSEERRVGKECLL